MIDHLLEHESSVTYEGLHWIPGASLPNEIESWPSQAGYDHHPDVISNYTKNKNWSAPDRPVYFFCDQHADAEAFTLSLLASGGVKKTGVQDHEFELTEEGEKALFVIGGDCFDKGPSNLRLLDTIALLKERGAEVKILAGNHDIRTYMGMKFAESNDVLHDHLFVRMGKKTVPLIHELYLKHQKEIDERAKDFDTLQSERLLFPSITWAWAFSSQAKPYFLKDKLTKEIARIHEKVGQFLEAIEKCHMTLPQVHATVYKFHEEFLEEGGTYYWFFNEMDLACQEGSYLFVHGGVDDTVAELLRDQGLDALNDKFKWLLTHSPFQLYHGEIGNTFRTKYRNNDHPLTDMGTQHLNQCGIYALVHGHKNVLKGPRMIINKGILNFECDSSVDINTRRIEGLDGPGGSVVIFTTNQQVLSVSTDHPRVKRFSPTNNVF